VQRTYRDGPHRTTLGDLRRDVDRRTRRCVRCGLMPPAPDLFICGGCEAEPATMAERRAVEEEVLDPVEQRRVLVDAYGWRGGWWR
jgi:hypothetical protein